MGNMIQLTAADGHKFSAYRAEPAGKPKGALIVVMEIFGVNSHIKKVTDEYAADGYLAIAPAMFDRVQRGLDIGYTPPDIEVGARHHAEDEARRRHQGRRRRRMQNVASAGKVGIVGYCWGGTVAWKSACDVRGLACAIAVLRRRHPGMIAETAEMSGDVSLGRDRSVDPAREGEGSRGRAQEPDALLLSRRSRLQLRPARLV